MPMNHLCNKKSSSLHLVLFEKLFKAKKFLENIHEKLNY